MIDRILPVKYARILSVYAIMTNKFTKITCQNGEFISLSFDGMKFSVISHSKLDDHSIAYRACSALTL